jgi:NAD-dependent deacetylase
MVTDEGAIERAARILSRVERLVVSTGAGVSKESGIPTFREGPSALWGEFDPEELATPEGFLRQPEVVWRWYAERRRMIAAAEPNPGHRAIAELERWIPSVVVVTQNIDDLHRKAGSSRIVELHGNIFRYVCFDRGHPFREHPIPEEGPPRCHCGSMIRPAVVWFGEALPEKAVAEALAEIERCDAMLVVGTSGVVFPAASYPLIAKQRGATIVAVNLEPTPITEIADLFLRGPSGEILPRVVDALRRLKEADGS